MRVDNEELLTLISTEIFKREIVDGDSSDDAKKKVAKAEKATTKQKKED